VADSVGVLSVLIFNCSYSVGGKSPSASCSLSPLWKPIQCRRPASSEIRRFLSSASLPGHPLTTGCCDAMSLSVRAPRVRAPSRSLGRARPLRLSRQDHRHPVMHSRHQLVWSSRDDRAARDDLARFVVSAPSAAVGPLRHHSLAYFIPLADDQVPAAAEQGCTALRTSQELRPRSVRLPPLDADSM
jgi:hypothetical protein